MKKSLYYCVLCTLLTATLALMTTESFARKSAFDGREFVSPLQHLRFLGKTMHAKSAGTLGPTLGKTDEDFKNLAFEAASLVLFGKANADATSAANSYGQRDLDNDEKTAGRFMLWSLRKAVMLYKGLNGNVLTLEDFVGAFAAPIINGTPGEKDIEHFATSTAYLTRLMPGWSGGIAGLQDQLPAAQFTKLQQVYAAIEGVGIVSDDEALAYIKSRESFDAALGTKDAPAKSQAVVFENMNNLSDRELRRTFTLFRSDAGHKHDLTFHKTKLSHAQKALLSTQLPENTRKLSFIDMGRGNYPNWISDVEELHLEGASINSQYFVWDKEMQVKGVGSLILRNTRITDNSPSFVSHLVTDDSLHTVDFGKLAVQDYQLAVLPRSLKKLYAAPKETGVVVLRGFARHLSTLANLEHYGLPRTADMKKMDSALDEDNLESQLINAEYKSRYKAGALKDVPLGLIYLKEKLTRAMTIGYFKPDGSEAVVGDVSREANPLTTWEIDTDRLSLDINAHVRRVKGVIDANSRTLRKIRLFSSSVRGVINNYTEHRFDGSKYSAEDKLTEAYKNWRYDRFILRSFKGRFMPIVPRNIAVEVVFSTDLLKGLGAYDEKDEEFETITFINGV